MVELFGALCVSNTHMFTSKRSAFYLMKLNWIIYGLMMSCMINAVDGSNSSEKRPGGMPTEGIYIHRLNMKHIYTYMYCFVVETTNSAETKGVEMYFWFAQSVVYCITILIVLTGIIIFVLVREFSRALLSPTKTCAFVGCVYISYIRCFYV